VAVADVYDALTSKRVYKDMYPHAIARSMIVGEAGSHFDPDIVEAFVACEDEFVAVARRFAEVPARPRPELSWRNSDPQPADHAAPQSP
jgi:putative two-component system response regulator